ncbi:unnamed protein product [Caenorhabditis bovis]|uniref:PhzF family phenazine biosynthesis protein n=1 Tax=Caenorhabditis bovis TaxID=2654633 RepID=A0A8S1F451_9PELO|nr:unnamed protein product [Caenorhabditis bovis]
MQQQFPSFIVDAFTTERFAGNPAAVCLIPQVLADVDYQKIAAEFNLSETAFPVPIGFTDYKTCSQFNLRWFTPKTEVPLCGHATLATSHVIFNEIGNINDEIKFNTKSGVLVVRKSGNGPALEMNFPQYELTSVKFSHAENQLRGILSEFHAPPYLCDIVKCVFPAETIVESVAYSALAKKLLIVIDPNTTKFELEAIKIDSARMLQLHDGSFVRGIAITVKPTSAINQGFTNSLNEPYDYACRYFAPWVGIEEDPATGSAQCALAPLWAAITKSNKLYAFQSYPGRGAEFHLSLIDDRVNIVGTSVTVMSGQITLNDPKFY